jgi:hypothetical protein
MGNVEHVELEELIYNNIRILKSIMIPMIPKVFKRCS